MADGEESSSSGRSGFTYILLFVLVLIVLALVSGGWYINHNRINQLNNSLEQTQKQAQQAQQDAAKQKEQAREMVQGMDDPAQKLALVQAYGASIRPFLTKTRQADLDAVMVYVNGNPKVLITKNPVLPAVVATAVNNLKTSVRNLKLAGIVTMDKIDKATYSPGEVVTLTGTIVFVADDEDLGGSIFSLTDSKGDIYYFHFNDTNSTNIKTNMLNDEVKVTVKVTSKVNEPLTFQVVSGPTLATASVTPTNSVSPLPTQ